jgi:LacI family transcriptional regulator
VREVKNVEALLSSRVEGLVLSLSKETRDFSHFRNLVDKHVPMVFFDRVCQEINTDRVINDDNIGAYKAVTHLISRGCKRIAHLSTSRELLIGKNRYEGYIRALKEHDLPVDERLVVRCDTHQSARLVTKRLVYETSPPDGLFAVNDLTAIGAMQTIKECGLQIPDDIAVVGYGNGNYSTMTDPPLTTVEQYGYQMGEKAMRMLLDRIIGVDDIPARTEEVNTELIVRESTVKKRKYSV